MGIGGSYYYSNCSPYYIYATSQTYYRLLSEEEFDEQFDQDIEFMDTELINEFLDGFARKELKV